MNTDRRKCSGLKRWDSRLLISALLATVSWSSVAAEQPLAAADYNLPAEQRNARRVAFATANAPACVPPEEFARLIARDGLPPVLVVTADRDLPLWRRDTVPVSLREQMQAGQTPSLALTAQPGEFRVFQLGVIPIASDLTDLEVEFAPLNGEKNSMPAKSFRCLSLGGIGNDARPFRKTINVSRGSIQSLWIGVDVPVDAAGVYRGTLRISSRPHAPVEVALALEIVGERVAEEGAKDAWRLSRLRWLDSTIGREEILPRGFAPVRVEDATIHLPGRRVTLGADGLPAQIVSTFSGSNTRTDAPPQPLLAAPLRLVVETAQGPVAWRTTSVPPSPKLEYDLRAAWPLQADADGLQLSGEGRLEFDGFARFRLLLTATRELAVRDVRLEIPYAENAARYFMGLEHAGGARPATLDWKWGVAKKHQDAFWLGSVNNGATWRFRDEHYRRPLVNIYYPFRPLVEPESWGNGGRGGIALDASKDGRVLVRVYSGPRTLRAGQTLTCEFDAMFTPAKPIDTDRRWRDRVVHPSETAGGNAAEAALAAVPESTATIINIHHRKDQNPFINYPYGDAAFPLLVDFIRRAHEQQARVKVYYTTREVTQQFPELWALHSLDGEIVAPGPGAEARTVVNKNGPDPWLIENLGGSFIPAWRATLAGRFEGARDLAVITTPDSRWNNFYLEGLDYLCRHAAIDGLYLDDTALSRESLLRARRILEKHRPAPHLDLHSWNPFKPLGSFGHSAIIYTELMPYLDRLWLGEGFNYDQPPDYWLTAIAGIPFGVMSEMLQGGGQPWRGMVFGMTSRLGWGRADPRALWHYWDRFGMEGAEMIGWWDEACPVRTGRADVLATVYRKPGRVLIAIASWSAKDEQIRLEIDWAALGLRPATVRARAAAIEGFQDAAEIDLAAQVSIPGNRGLLIEALGKD